MNTAFVLNNTFIESVTTGPVPGDPIKKDTILTSNFDGYTIIHRTRRVMRLKRYPKPINILNALTPYNGIVKPDPDDIQIIFSRKYGIQAFYRRGNCVDEPVLPENEIPTATFVTFLHCIPNSVSAPRQRQLPTPPSSAPQTLTQAPPINSVQNPLESQISGPSQLPPLASREDTLEIINYIKRKIREEEDQNIAEVSELLDPTPPQQEATESAVDGSDFRSTIIRSALAGVATGLVVLYYLGMPLLPAALS